MAKIHSYIVSGKGAFPLDMLRYDSAYPADPRAVDTIHDALRGLELTGGVRFTARLRSQFPPTVARWNSFGVAVAVEKS